MLLKIFLLHYSPRRIKHNSVRKCDKLFEKREENITIVTLVILLYKVCYCVANVLG